MVLLKLTHLCLHSCVGYVVNSPADHCNRKNCENKAYDALNLGSRLALQIFIDLFQQAVGKPDEDNEDACIHHDNRYAIQLVDSLVHLDEVVD